MTLSHMRYHIWRFSSPSYSSGSEDKPSYRIPKSDLKGGGAIEPPKVRTEREKETRDTIMPVPRIKRSGSRSLSIVIDRCAYRARSSIATSTHARV